MPVAIMEPHNWPKEWLAWDLSEYRDGFLSGASAAHWISESIQSRDPLGLFSLSDGDVAFWAYRELRNSLRDHYWLEFLMRTSGLNTEGIYGLSDEFDAAVRSSSTWLLQYRWEPAERFTLAALHAKGARLHDGVIECDGTHSKLDCNVIYQLHDHGVWWDLLSGRRLCIISGSAARVAEQLSNSDLIVANGGKISWTIEAVFQCPDIRKPKTAYWRRLEKVLFLPKWDLCLCSAGSLSTLICTAARDVGRQALDIGAFDVVLLGGQHSRCRGMVS